MSLLIVSPDRNAKPFADAIRKIDANIDIEVWPAVEKPERVQFAVAWNHPKHLFDKFPNLRVISSMGAGVDHLMSDDTIPSGITFTRLVGPSLSGQMCDFVLTSVLNIIRNTEIYYQQQKRGEWKTHQPLQKRDITVGVLGLGALGGSVAGRLIENGFSVNGWAASKKEIDGVNTFSGEELGDFLAATNIVVCLLPLTEKTDGILDLALFKKLKQPAYVINAARGAHLVDEDLIYALDMGIISHATLDVFNEEPLPGSHPFWGREKITITPHIASLTDPDEIAELLVENYKRLLSGMPLLYEVDRKKGY
ncbi:MAG: glyoxylate/hydroxypyruvate reductase A [Balneolaceae bacterium]|nr:MAG: glyoxylate/hydroxypyruvate reductase A [Balneolaceae bacterium]